ncbi:hypothetical protein ACHWUR_29365 [Klebsiella pneumoniae]
MGGSGGSQSIGDIVPPQQVELDPLHATPCSLNPMQPRASRCRSAARKLGLGPVEGESVSNGQPLAGPSSVEGPVVQVQHGGAVGG